MILIRGIHVNRRVRRTLAAALAVPAATVLSYAPVAPAATVLAAEGTLQPTRSTQSAFSRTFCVRNTCRSINNARTPLDVSTGSYQLQAAVDATPGDIILMGYSLGAASIYDRMRKWAKTPALAPDPQRVVLVVTFGNPENRFGGSNRKAANTGLPAVQPHPHLDVTLQYDSVADQPTRWGWYSSMNNAFARHLEYFQPVDINNPNNLIHQDGTGTTYMLIKADVLPMLKWQAWFTSPARMAELDARYRPLIEKDYDRPAYSPQGEGADWGNGNPPPTVQTTDAEPSSRELQSGADHAALTSDDGQPSRGAAPKREPVDADETAADTADGTGDETGEATELDATRGEPASDRQAETESESETESQADPVDNDDSSPAGAP